MLEQITCPADLRRLSYDQLNSLSSDIRQFIVDTVEENGGHLGSNLGVVELTIALHRVFDSPVTFFCGTPDIRLTFTRCLLGDWETSKRYEKAEASLDTQADLSLNTIGLKIVMLLLH